MKKNSVFIAEIERFGYIMRTADTTAEKAKKALLDAYIESYIDINGIHPKDDIIVDGLDRSYYDVACEEVNVRELVFGTVEWT